MGFSSKIQWTDHTFNPWWGCTKVSDGCKFCYAETLANRYGHDVWGPGRTRRTMGEGYWQEPLRWNTKARNEGTRFRVFCASMADVFDPEGPAAERARLWELIAATPHLDWQILTKRPELIREYLPANWRRGYDNVWLGTSVEDERVRHRVDTLRDVPARIRFLSLEPLIGPIPDLDLTGFHWAIVGGESGPGARPMRLAWVQDLRRQCRDANVAYFFKQTGSVLARELGSTGKGGDDHTLSLISSRLTARQMPRIPTAAQRAVARQRALLRTTPRATRPRRVTRRTVIV